MLARRARATIYSMIRTTWCISPPSTFQGIAFVLKYENKSHYIFNWFAAFGAFRHKVHCKILHMMHKKYLSSNHHHLCCGMYAVITFADGPKSHKVQNVLVYCTFLRFENRPPLYSLICTTSSALIRCSALKQCTESDKFNALHNDIQLSPTFAKKNMFCWL